jgi:hypothetical protein
MGTGRRTAPDLSGRCGADRRIRRSGRASRPAGSTDYDKFDETDPVVCVSLNLAHRSPAATPCARSDARGQHAAADRRGPIVAQLVVHLCGRKVLIQAASKPGDQHAEPGWTLGPSKPRLAERSAHGQLLRHQPDKTLISSSGQLMSNSLPSGLTSTRDRPATMSAMPNPAASCGASTTRWPGLASCRRPCRRQPSANGLIRRGESGPSHRPMDPAWVEGLHYACRAAEVAFFFKLLCTRSRRGSRANTTGRLWSSPMASCLPALRRRGGS